VLILKDPTGIDRVFFCLLFFFDTDIISLTEKMYHISISESGAFLSGI